MTSTRRKEKERELRRDQILEAARQVFNAKGFLGATMEEIALKADYSQATLYTYFKNKYELYTTLAQGLLEDLAQAFEEVDRHPDLNPLEKIRRCPKVMFDVYTRDPMTLVNLFRLQASPNLKDLTPEMVDNLNGVSARVIRLLARIYQEGVDQNLFVREHPWAVADSIWGLFTGLVLWEESKRFFDARRSFLQPTLETAIRIFVDGLTRGAGVEPAKP
jgi:AcrR family transcriptional regulator